MNTTRFLTGITTSGSPHLGNYVGSIRPAVRASLGHNALSFYFLADYHALIKTDNPFRVQRSTLEIAASWLAAGLDPARVIFYRQSDIPEIPELAWFLSCVLGKGVLNRAHAYKAAVDQNVAIGADPDADVSVGLFMYPVLMAADILIFNAHQVPVGRDQVQHIEMARDMAGTFNHRYGDHFVIPQAVIEAHVATLPGLDGRKMSKSYDNTILLFSSRADLQKRVYGIVTDSSALGTPKSTTDSALFQIYQAFANADETAKMQQTFAAGASWAEIKQQVFERIDHEIAPMRGRYQSLIDNPALIEAILADGAARARALAIPLMRQLRHAVGLRDLRTSTPNDDHNTQGTAHPVTATSPQARATRPVFKQYREGDGQFHFKLTDARGRTLLQSTGFDQPQSAAQVILALTTQGAAALTEWAGHLTHGETASDEDIAAALAALVQR